MAKFKLLTLMDWIHSVLMVVFLVSSTLGGFLVRPYAGFLTMAMASLTLLILLTISE